jgi:hypothetical protein
MRAAIWLGRIVLIGATAILVLISAHFLLDTAAQSAARGIALTSPLGVTIFRVGFGAFPLASAIVTASSFGSVDRMRRGLWFIVILFGTVLVVRVGGAVSDGSLMESVRLIVPEVIFVALSAVALALGRDRPR